MLREGQGFLKVQVAEESCQRAVWQQPLHLPQTEQELLVRRSCTRDCPPSPFGQASILISPGQARGIGHRDPHHAWVRRYLPWPEGYLSRNITGVIWEEDLGGGLEEPLDMPVHLMIQDLETEDLSCLPHLPA